MTDKEIEPTKWGDNGRGKGLLISAKDLPRAVARFTGWELDVRSHLGFRCAPPQALCCRLLRRLRQCYCGIFWQASRIEHGESLGP